MLFHIPPNLVAAAARNAVPLRVDVDLSQAPPPEQLPALALLQRWTHGDAEPPKLIQLSRMQLRELVAAAGGQPIFLYNGERSAWPRPELLEEPSSGAQPGTATQGRGRSSLPSRRSGNSESGKSAGRSPAAPRPDEEAEDLVGTLDGSEHFLSVSLPSREHPCYRSLLEFLKANGFSLEPSNRRWWLRDRHKVLNLLATQGHRLRENFDLEETPNFTARTAHLREAQVNATVEESGPDDFVLNLDLAAGGAPEAELRSALATGRHYIEHGGRIYLFDEARLAKLADAQQALATAASQRQAGPAAHSTLRISRERVPQAQDILDELAPNFRPTDEWERRSRALRELSRLPPAPVPPELQATLRPYQRLGVAWLWYLQEQRLGGVLADEMGLGKTLQALALLAALTASAKNNGAAPQPAIDGAAAALSPAGDTPKKAGARPRGGQRAHKVKPPSAGAKALVVAPASLLENWRREAQRYTPQLRVLVHHGVNRLRKAEAFAAHELIITSYGTLSRDRKLFAEVEFACAIADEAQHIKNRHSQNATALRALRADTRFVLTGTPLENSLDDLRSLFAFLMPGLLPALPLGAGAEDRAWHDAQTRHATAPYILRRTKAAVAPELPKKIEQTIWCEPTPAQAALYRQWQETSERELIDLAASGASEGRLRLATLTQLLRLRQICCDPRLVSPQAHRAADSAKLAALLELLEEAIDDGHRVLVFSQFTSLFALLRPELDQLGIAHAYLDGTMNATERQREVDRFQRSPDIPVFLLSLRAGGTGLNLTAADTVVHLDPWWNPAVEAQATDRAHRIGQTRTVTSYKLICSGTVEEKVLALQEEKRAALADVFEASDAANARLSLSDLRSLLTAE
ncbi:serine/threonine protein kinase [Cephaloticoccus primus]|uniref:Serine/threonine protein kinase n=1 Tax=Cephaloticoccus primus TaxID=1548207 RepID=A0A139SUU6_9BACT|nr:serine/threonine protein kinase [Cephaloticoccus primus]